MKKILIIITLAFSLFFSANVLQAKTFTRSSETVSFSGADYTLLKSPFDDFTNIDGWYGTYFYPTPYKIEIYDVEFDNRSIKTLVNSLGQYKYGDLALLFYESIQEWDSYGKLWMNEYLNMFDVYDDFIVYYYLSIDYTFTSPSDIIVNVDTNGWFQAGTNVSKVSLDLYVYMDSNDQMGINFYLNFYDNNNVLINSSGAFGGLDTWIGIGFYGILQVDYDKGYQAGFSNGESKGLNDGYDNGYKDGKKDYGYNDNGTIISGDIAWNKGYDRGANDNMPNFFVLITDSVFSAVTRIGNIEILPNLKISYIAGIILALGLVKFITGRKGDD